MSGLLTTGILQQIKNRVSGTYLLDLYPNAALAYSMLRLKGTASNSLRASEVGLSEQDIALGSVEIDGASLTTFADGALATATKWIDQSGNFVNLPQTTKANQPNITDASGNSLGYIDTTNDYSADVKSLITTNSGRPATNADYVLAVVFKNNTSSTTDSAVFCVKNSDSDSIGFNIRRSGGNYLVDVARNVTLNPTSGFTIARGLTDWVLLTITVIGGTLTCYADGVSQSKGTGGTVDIRGASGVWTARRNIIPTTQPRWIHLKTIVMYSDSDLSAFDITSFNNEMKTIHGIS